MLNLQCKRCNHTWNKRTKKPKRCPACKSPYWNIDKRIFERKEFVSVRMLETIKSYYPKFEYEVDILIELIKREENEK